MCSHSRANAPLLVHNTGLPERRQERTAMPLVKAYDEVENPRIQRNLPNGHFGWRTDFIQRPDDKSVDTPMAFLAEGSPSRVLRAHFHEVDQFQVIYNGSGSLGKTPVKPG